MRYAPLAFTACIAVLGSACGAPPAVPRAHEPTLDARSARATGSGPSALQSLDVQDIGGAGGRLPRLGVGNDGRLHLAWLEPVGDQSQAVKIASWDGSSWSTPATAVEAADIVTHWTAAPDVAVLADGTTAVQWLAAAPNGSFGTDVRVAVIEPASAATAAFVSPNEPADKAENGFGRLLALDNGFEVIWLDARNQDLATPGPSGDQPDVSLRALRIDGDGVPADAGVIDPRACDCCSVDGAVLGDGRLIVAYRDRSASNARDIAVARFEDGWSDPIPVGPTGWQIDACPVNGPALDASGDRVAVASFTPPGVEGGGTWVVFSSDGGATFDPPIRVDSGQPVGQVDVALDSKGAVVSWLEGSNIHVRRVGPDAKDTLSPLIASIPDASLEYGRPSIATLGGDAWLAWAVAGIDGGVRVARLPD